MCTLGRPAMDPITTSSTLGCVAAVIDTESPSQPRPAVIQSMCTSLTAGAFCVDRPYGTVSVAIAGCSFQIRLLAHINIGFPRAENISPLQTHRSSAICNVLLRSQLGS